MTRRIGWCALLVGWLATPALGVGIEYTLALRGVDPSEYATLAPGRYTLEVYGRAFDNEFAPGRFGGILQAAIDLESDNVNSAAFVGLRAGVGPWSYRWGGGVLGGREYHPLFTGVLSGQVPEMFPGTRVPPTQILGDSVVGNTMTIWQSDHASSAESIGSTAPTLLTTGLIEYLGARSKIAVAVAPNVSRFQLVYGQLANGEFGAIPADTVLTPSLALGVPEPNAALVVGSAALAFATRLNRRRESR